jgi:hypothetical protein
MKPSLSSECWTVVATLTLRGSTCNHVWRWDEDYPREVQDILNARERGEIITCQRKTPDGYELVARLPKLLTHYKFQRVR